MKVPYIYWITYLWTLPFDIVVWVVVLLFRLLWGKELQLRNGLWAILKKDSWFVRKLYFGFGGTTFGHGGIIVEGFEGGYGVDTDVEGHEEVGHVPQYEAAQLWGFVFSIGWGFFGYFVSGDFPLVGFLVSWNISWPMFYLGTVLQAWIRGENAYKGSFLEEAAYSLTREWMRGRDKE